MASRIDDNSSLEDDLNRLSFDSDINILLLGQTGVGKTTFINAFTNYLSYDSFTSALQGEIISLIPASFHVMNPKTFQSTKIHIGNPDMNEHADDRGQSNTQACQSYKFIFGNRNLRLIDAPGIGDTRGLEQDAKNFEHILAFISQYKYLNGICILLKPNEERLNILFRFCIKELLTHLHISARENIMFVFTNSRSTFYAPGATAPQLRILLDDLRRSTHVDVPFSGENTFCLDNEVFRFMAIYKHGMAFPSEQLQNYAESWNVSSTEYIRLFSHIVNCKPHHVQDTLSINEAQQLIRKLGRPISEVTRLINKNLVLARQYEEQLRACPSNERDKFEFLPQKSARFVSLRYPCTVCTSDQCTRVIFVDNEVKLEYASECHRNCRLRKIEQEVINHPALIFCSSMDRTTGHCKNCGCKYEKHMHITYRYQEYTTYIEMKSNCRQSNRSSITYETWLSTIHNRINDLKEEQQCMMNIAMKLSCYLHQNAISPYNDDFLAYLDLFIHEEQLKQTVNHSNEVLIDDLQRLANQYRQEIDLFQNTMPRLTVEQKISISTTESTMKGVKEIFDLVTKLYSLPINGSLIREQVEGLKDSQRRKIQDHEIVIKVPCSGTVCSIVEQLDFVLSPTIVTSI